MSNLAQSLAQNIKALPAQSNSLAMKMRQKIKIYKNTNILRKVKQEKEQKDARRYKTLSTKLLKISSNHGRFILH
jgi:hypothetical protein